MEKWIYILERWQKILWGMPMLVLLLASGALLMVKTRFFLFRKSDLIVRKTIGSLGAKKQQGITSFQAVTTALAGTLGVGSIVGVATAITMGGAGALFWMCVSALFGMMCKYGEVVLAMHYRHKENGVSYGGAMYVLEKGVSYAGFRCSVRTVLHTCLLWNREYYTDQYDRGECACLFTASAIVYYSFTGSAGCFSYIR